MDFSELIIFDGAVVNTENETVPLLPLKKNARKELKHLICILHTKDLLLLHVLFKLDGGTRGPKIFADSIGVRVMGREHVCTALFESIHVSGPS